MAESPRADTGRPEQDPTTHIGSIVVDCTHLDQMIRFWSAALHYIPQGPVRPDGVMLVDPRNRGPKLNMNLSNEGPAKEYRLHLDLYVSDPRGELNRFLQLGAVVRQPPTKGHDFVELADPDGNPFCLIDTDWPQHRDYWGDDWAYGDHP